MIRAVAAATAHSSQCFPALSGPGHTGCLVPPLCQCLPDLYGKALGGASFDKLPGQHLQAGMAYVIHPQYISSNLKGPDLRAGTSVAISQQLTPRCHQCRCNSYPVAPATPLWWISGWGTSAGASYRYGVGAFFPCTPGPAFTYLPFQESYLRAYLLRLT